MNIAIIGAGPIGGILAAHLIRSKETVYLADVDEGIISAIKEKGITITGPAAEKMAGEFTVMPARAVVAISELDNLDVVFVCTKATVLDKVASDLKRSWRKGTILVSFQNGIDTEDILSSVAGEDLTLRAIVNYAGHMLEPGTYSINWFTPPNYIGSLTERATGVAKKVADVLNKAALATEVVNDIKKRAYEKTALNATLCPICTLTGLTMGEAMKGPNTRKLVVEILKEARTVADKMGWKFEKTLEDWLEYLDKGGSHRTSMALDMAGGRKTEIYFMNGKICEYGKKLGVPTPFNDAMRWSVLGKEHKGTSKNSTLLFERA